jgi:broad specificity phosphatase PhoE
MERIRTRMGLDPLAYRTDPLLMEVHFGDWQGHMMEEFEAAGVGSAELLRQREGDKWNFVPPGIHAESYMILSQRIARWLETVQGKTVCVTHGGCIRTLFHLIEGLSGQDAAHLSVPQDKILKLENNHLEWI